MAANGQGYRATFGSWHTIHTRMNRWSKNGVPDQLFEHVRRKQIVRIELEVVQPRPI